MRRFCKSVITAGVFLSTCNAVAADFTAASAPAGAVNALQNLTQVYDPGRVSSQVQQAMPRLQNYAPKPLVSAPKQAPASNSDKIHFKLMRIVVKGNTIFPKRVFSDIFKSSMKQQITLTDLQNMVHQVTTKYREAGYILTRAILPPQVIKDGVVQVQIIEGFVSGVKINGDMGRLQPLLQSYGDHIMQSRPLQIHVLERYALLANDLPGVSVQTVITPSKTVPAGADLTLVVVSRRHLSGFVTYDNYGTRYIGPDEVAVGASLYSVFVPGDSNNLRISTTSNTHELRFIEVTHAQPIGANGLHWQFGSDFTETRPDFILEPLEIIGRNFLVFTDFSYPIIRDRSLNFSVHTTANYQNSTSTILTQPFYQDRIRSLVIGGNFDNTDSWHGISTVNFDVTHGFPIFGAHDHELQSRPLGQASYTRLNSAVSRLQGLTSRFSIFATIRGQYTSVPLLATEQYGVGGPDIGRGYDPSEIVGDKGISGKVELRFDTAPGMRLLNAVEYYMFYDAGMIWNNDDVNLPAKQDLTSTGIGARISFMPNLSATLFIARPLTRKVATMVALQHNPNQVRGYFQFVLTA
ncbi:MAG: ShlB/FhaC/HecB family hemolysin secretion/activation protein [Pseudomonadota bacterium]